MTFDYLSEDLIRLIASYLDAASIISFSRVNLSINQYCLPQDCPTWREALFKLLPVHVSETGKYFARSPNIHPLNLRGLVASLSKPGNFSKVKKLKEKEKLMRFSKPVQKTAKSEKSLLVRLLKTGAAEAALLKHANRAEALSALRQNFAILPKQIQQKISKSQIIRDSFPDFDFLK